jgi:shikimate dehydrogenase
MLRRFGLIGFPLSHSFSPKYFREKFEKECIDAAYDLFPLKNLSEWPGLLESCSFSGINVTLPYKTSIMPYLDEIDTEAAIIGAVNTIQFRDGKTKGYNTDVWGFEHSLLQLISSPDHIREALVLGSGGSSKAVIYVLKKLGIPFLTVSRDAGRGDVTYDTIPDTFWKGPGLVINTTPLGMFPHEERYPDLPYQKLHSDIYLYDLIYNPTVTSFMKQGMAHLCQIKNGHDMLILQAEKSWEIWNQP